MTTPPTNTTTSATDRYVPQTSLYLRQWHLKAIGDLERIWSEYRGAGIHVGIMDDGIESSHPALWANYDASLDVAGYPASSGTGVHGTAVAGLIAANGRAVGVAMEAAITGIPWMAVDVPGSFDNLGRFDVINNSWGAKYPFAYTLEAGASTFADAVHNGRNGLGTIVVKASGNSGDPDQGVQSDANFDSVSSSRYVIAVGAIGTYETYWIGNTPVTYIYRDEVSSFSTRGADLLVSAPGVQLATTDRSGASGYGTGDYVTNFMGTSGAAPIVSGVVALMVSANPGLGWRDVRQILALTADQVTLDDQYSWTVNAATSVNGGGMHFSNDVGFGQVDAFEAVRLAEAWSLFGSPQTSANEASVLTSSSPFADLGGKSWSYSFEVKQDLRLERADLTLGLAGGALGLSDLWIELISQAGTVSILSGYNTASTGESEIPTVWTYGSEAFRGELTAGVWTVVVKPLSATASLSGVVDRLDLALYGSEITENDVYHFTDEGVAAAAVGSVTVLSDSNGGDDWVNAAALVDDVALDLRAGATTRVGSVVLFEVAAGTEMENAVTGDGNDTLVGNAKANKLVGMRGNDTLEGGGGNDTLDGGDGVDRAVFTGARAEYVLSRDAAGWLTVRDTRLQRDGTDHLAHVEALVFSDGTYNASVNMAPSAITLTGGTVYENSGIGTWVATATGVDPFDSLTYSLLALDGTPFSGPFAIDSRSGQISVVAATIDYETLRSYSFVVKVTDTEGLSYAQQFGIDVVNLSYTIELSSAGWLKGSVEEDVLKGSASNDRIEGLEGNDTLAGGAGSDILDGGEGTDVAVFTGARADYALSYDSAGHLVVRSLAGSGGGVDLLRNIEVLQFSDAPEVRVSANRTPTDIVFTEVGVRENSRSGTVVAQATGIDPDTNVTGLDETLSYALLDPSGNLYRGPFAIDRQRGTITVSEATLDYETTRAYRVIVRVTDAAGRSFDKPLLIPVINEANASSQTGSTDLAGTQEEDRLEGGALGDSLRAQGGNDTLLGRGGADRLEGGAGNDLLDGGTGADTMAGGSGDDVYVVDDRGDVVDEAPGDGIDTVRASLTSYTLGTEVENLEMTRAPSTSGLGIQATGNGKANRMTGSSGADILTGGGGADTLLGGAGSDTLRGGSESDSLDGGSGADSMVGGGGADTYVIDDRGDTTDAGSDDLVIVRVAGYDLSRLNGARTVFALTGTVADEVLAGGQFNDTLDGGAGRDTLNGGWGDDTYVVDSEGDVVVDDGGVDTVRTALASYVLAAGVEKLILTSSTGIAGSGNALDNAITAGAGADVLFGLGGRDTLQGGGAGDTLWGGADADRVEGGDGDDELHGDEGADTLLGGTGSDQLVGSDGADSLDGGSGADTMLGGAGVDTFVIDDLGDRTDADALDSVIVKVSGYDTSLLKDAKVRFAHSGSIGNDYLSGGVLNDSLDGSAGSDTLIGGAGNDLYVVDESGDLVVELVGEGNDTVRTTLSRFTLPDEVEQLSFTGTGAATLQGNGLANFIMANSGDDSLRGEDGADTLQGFAGNDTLAADGPGDLLFGGAGRDVFVFSRSDAANGGAAIDVIADFQAGLDIIDLRAIKPDPAGGEMTWLGSALRDGGCGAAFSSGHLRVDWTGDGQADLTIRLAGVKTLTADAVVF